MKTKLFPSKDFIDKSAKAIIDNPQMLSKVLASESFEQLYGGWSHSMVDPIHRYIHVANGLEKKLNYQVRNFWYGVISHLMVLLAVYLFYYDNEQVMKALVSIVLIIVPYCTIWMLLNYTFIQLKAINATSILLKELSLATAMSFDHFFQHGQIKEQYIHLSKTYTMELYDEHRKYLAVALNEIVFIFLKKHKFSKTIKIRSLDNLMKYNEMLLKQFDSRAYLNDNYLNIFKHSQNKFA